jgi:hypothetical protein
MLPLSQNETSLRPSAPSQNFLVRFAHLTLQPFNGPRSDTGIPRYQVDVCDSMVCHLSLAPPAATRFPPWIIIAVIVVPHRRQFRRGSLMRNTCNN